MHLKKKKFVLSEKTVKTISELNNKFESLNNVKEDNVYCKNNNFKPRIVKIKSDNTIPIFNNNKSPIKKEEDNLSKIRSLLNKISDINFKEIHSSLTGLISSVLLLNKDDVELIHISTLIFELASTNSFYSKLYANLFTKLLNDFEFLRSCFNDTFNSYKDIFSSFRSNSDTSKDYNLYCQINKENDKRRALSKFFVNLAINKIINEEEILSFIELFLQKIAELTKDENNTELVNEIVENIYILYQKDFIKNVSNKEHLEKIYIKINFYTQCETKNLKSLSSKTKFKFMDMLE